VTHLQDGGCVLLGYQKDSGIGHIALVIKENKNTITIVNHFIDKKHSTIHLMKKEKFKKYIRRENLAFLVSKI
jgi:UTP-glucose-1-phosphate uridylyltransferase